MRDMNNKRFVFLCFVLIILGSYYLLFETVPKLENKEKGELNKFCDFSKSDVIGIKLVSKGDTIIIERKQGEWLIKEPVPSKADASAVNTYLQYYAGIIEIMVVEEAPSDLSRFGLENPKLEVTLNMDHNLSPVNIMIGNKNPNNTCVTRRKKNYHKYCWLV